MFFRDDYVIPVFQRGYVWTLEKQVVPLWADLADRAHRRLEYQAHLQQVGAQPLRPVQKHFLGSIVLTPQAPTFGRVLAYEVIDGQQRTTTLHLLLLAFRLAARLLPQAEISAMLDGLIRNPGPYSCASDHFKVWPTEAGRSEIEFLSQASGADEVCSRYPVKQGRQGVARPLMVQAFLYLHHACLAFLRGVDLEEPVEPTSDQSHNDALVHAIRHHNHVVALASERELLHERAEALFMALQEHVQIMTLVLEAEDDPQVIFETLNARGEPLLASDLVRNFVFMDAARRGLDVPALYAAFWARFDQQADLTQSGVSANLYWREKVRQGRLLHPRIELFLFHYTVLRRQEETKFGHIFQSFKEWWHTQKRDVPSELQTLVQTSVYFQELISPQGDDAVAEFARLVAVLDVSTLAPVYLALRERLARDSFELVQALRDLASYLVRRSICGLTTKNYNRVFLKLLRAIASTQYPAQVLRDELLRLGGETQYWPDDETFRKQWLDRPVYIEMRSAKVCAILRALEWFNRTGKQETRAVPAQASLSVEHVMPQSWADPAVLGWYPLAGNDDIHRRDRARRVHTFGNLTLVTQALNSAVSNGPFEDICVARESDHSTVRIPGKKTGLQGSLLVMNGYFQNLDRWNDAEIERRGQALFDQALRAWPRP